MIDFVEQQNRRDVTLKLINKRVSSIESRGDYKWKRKNNKKQITRAKSKEKK